LSDPSTTAWHALTADEVAARLGVDPRVGLSPEAAGARIREHGPNELAADRGPRAAGILARQLVEPLVLVLIAAAAISFVVWLIADEAEPLPYDAIVILGIVALNAMLGFVEEYRAERALLALGRLTAPAARVRRGGEVVRVAAREVVPGDVVLVEGGDRIPADLRLVEVARLKLDESALTGESMPVSKNPAPVEATAEPADRLDVAFMGTTAAYGRGTGIAIATGMATEMGAIAAMLSEGEEEETPLQRDLSQLGRQLGWLVLAISTVVAVAGVLRAGSRAPDVLLEVFLFAVALAVAAVPEGLPAIVTAVLALGVRRMAARHAIVRRLPAVEALGSATVIASDKTGTLTRNQMTATRVLLGADRAMEIEGDGFAPVGGFRESGGAAVDPSREPDLERLLALGALVNDARLVDRDGNWEIEGDPTEGALVVAARKVLDERVLRETHPRLAEIPFSSERKRMTTIHVLEGEPTAVVKGAPELVLERCARIRDRGNVRRLEEADRTAIHAWNVEFAKEALRALAVASRPMPRGWHPGAELPELEIEAELVWEGMVGMMDPPRPGVEESVARARRAGVRTIIVTGDHALTGQAVGVRVGISDADEPVLDGRDLERLSDEELRVQVATVPVFGRVRPEHKVRIVRALRSRGEVVAMTGDGVNDAPALKEADIGVAMGIAGTDVAREASDMILADDDYSTIVNAIEEGRKLYGNIRKFVRYLLSSNAGELLTILAALVAAGPLGLTSETGGIFLPLLAVQILWVNLISDGAPALALGIDPGERRVMERPPRKPSEPIVDRRMWIRIGVVGLTIMAGTVFVLDAYMPGGLFDFAAETAADPPRRARTMAFTTLVLFELLDVFNARHPTETIFRRESLRNRWLLAAVAFSLALQVAVVYWEPLQRGFGTVPLSGRDWLLAGVVASSVVVVVEALKRTRWAG
jgi:Ca2+-transporting ATPase